jgi:membrane protease YdiL (CAAX protease family)
LVEADGEAVVPTEPNLTWQARADEALLIGVPGRTRIVVEIVLVVALVLGGHVEAVSPSLGVTVLVLELVLALGLLRPWSASHRSAGAKLLALVVALATVGVPVLVQGPGGTTRRLGVELMASSALAKGPKAEGAAGPVYAEVKAVSSGTPAEGKLLPGDRIEAIGGEPLVGDDPTANLSLHVQSDALPDDTSVTVRRDGVVREVAVHIPRVGVLAKRLGLVSNVARDHVIAATALRDFVFIVFLLLLARLDGQPLSALGIAQAGATTELAVAIPAIGGVFVVQVVAAIPIAILSSLGSFGTHEATERLDTLSRLSGQTSMPEIVVSLVVAAAFEEVAFRAFLTPRVRRLSGSWVVAALLVSGLFGLGHVYEGTIAIAQTAILGLYFTAVFLMRRRLLAVVASHASFNAIMFVFVRLIVASGAVEKLKALAPH